MKENTGFVYILTNPSFKDDWVKIGKSSRPVDIRSKELDNTAVPLPFEIYATLQTAKYESVEKQLHKMIDMLTDLRIRQSREFFNIAPAKALELLRISAASLDDAEIAIYRNNKPYKDSPTDKVREVRQTSENHNKRSRFKFSMVDIEPGAKLTFIPTGVEVRVVDDDKIEYQDRIYKLSPFVGTFMPADKRNDSGAYQGAKYFMYNGELLDKMRMRIEKENSKIE